MKQKHFYEGKEKALTDAEACNDAMVEFNDAKKSYDECLIAKTNADANADANADINDLNTKLKTAKVQYKQKADILATVAGELCKREVKNFKNVKELDDCALDANGGEALVDAYKKEAEVIGGKCCKIP